MKYKLSTGKLALQCSFLFIFYGLKMDQQDIKKELLNVLLQQWESPKVLRKLEKLSDRIGDNHEWHKLIQAGILALKEGNADKSLVMLNESSNNNSTEIYAKFMIASVQYSQRNNITKSIDIYKDLLANGFRGELHEDLLTICAKLKLGLLLIKKEKYRQSVDKFGEIIQDYERCSDQTILEQVASAMLGKGLALWLENDVDGALDAYDQVIDRLKGFKEGPMITYVAIAMHEKTRAIWKKGDLVTVLGICDEIITRFKNTREIPVLIRYAQAMLKKGEVKIQQGSRKDAIATYTSLIEQLDHNHQEESVHEQIALAMLNRGNEYWIEKDYQLAIKDFECLIERFKDSNNTLLSNVVSQAMFVLIASYMRLEELEKSQNLLSDFSNRFSNSPDIVTEVMIDRVNSALAYHYGLDAEKGESSGSNLESWEKLTLGLLYQFVRGLWNDVYENIGEDRQEEYFKNMDESKERHETFIVGDSLLKNDCSVLFFLREWNSYTPVIPFENESDKGGGYFIKHDGEGIVIDPGYDFIQNFKTCGGRLSDINHIIITHAHDDHTAQFESMMMLLQRRWKKREELNAKPVNLYLNLGAFRKFTGLLDLKDPKVKKIVILQNHQNGDLARHCIKENSLDLTVLPAYHDDVITRNTSVGLGFEFIFNESPPKRVVFTGDSGLYPTIIDDDGKKRYYDQDNDLAVLDAKADKALYACYPVQYKRRPDLLIPHIGSIKKKEFAKPEEIFTARPMQPDLGGWYYENHLGLHGTLTMISNTRPKAAVISEFGSEMRDFHFELIEKIRQTLFRRQKKVSSRFHPETGIVVPGDITICYDIKNHKFMCHETCEFEDPEDLCCVQSSEWYPKSYKTKDREYIAEENSNPDRKHTYLFKKGSSVLKDKREIKGKIRTFMDKYFNHQLAYHKE